MPHTAVAAVCDRRSALVERRYNLCRSYSLALERLPAVLVALLDLGDSIHAGLPVLVFDVGGDFPPLFAQQAQHGHDRRVALAKRHVGAVILLPVFDVQRDDAVVVLANVLDGVAARGGEVADIQVDAKVARGPLHGAGEGLGGGELVGVGGIVVTVKAHHDLVFPGVGVDARGHADIGRGGDVFDAQGL